MIMTCRAAACAARRVAVGLVAAAALHVAPMSATPASAKLPGHQYCFHGTCHRVASIAETEALVGSDMTLSASFYDDCRNDRFNPCGLTSSGEPFRADRPDNAASPVFPDGTTLLLFNPRTKGAAIVRVNNAGPYWGKRKLDVSRAAADKLGFRRVGVAELQVRVIKAPTKTEATYKKNRQYPRLAGYIGNYISLSEAHRGMATVMAVEAMASSLMAPLTGGLLAAARQDPELKGLVDRPLARKQQDDGPKARSASGKTQAKAQLNGNARAKAKGKLASAGRKAKRAIAG